MPESNQGQIYVYFQLMQRWRIGLLCFLDTVVRAFMKTVVLVELCCQMPLLFVAIIR